jgi:hypothetical protein
MPKRPKRHSRLPRDTVSELTPDGEPDAIDPCGKNAVSAMTLAESFLRIS